MVVPCVRQRLQPHGAGRMTTTILTDAARAFSSPGLSAAPCTRPHPVAALHGNPVTAGGRRSALAVTGTPGPAPVLSDDRGRAREPEPPGPLLWVACDTRIVNRGRQCGTLPATPFRAVCGCMHLIDGNVCAACASAAVLACLDCWLLPKTRRHKCSVRFLEVEQ